ncbi:triacylglycerol lipase [Clostridium saccharoperbutylacetonicum]|uniref:Putative acetyltransferase/hydrolase n=1 Tax=Clostridium saccharoperbutylacetonicum N1-4(HMT) TaxID=931276 RepID=M1LTF2_9CLOT|nr:putative acetyltransferase/hydrolase [Clostridium saccharoperbutylacetonicum]AGF56290.1 putative acetyltransferase/hydrolase [Clostridium saccharoperbutylacetonicum N1-4(HMT)]NRT62967.1 triacylglycerol lipase [Clostridium saccharoperbutylacetonicum]NSB26324.1 triacylglycerol lipase [Clostridium saccharoperbutylacetonicum]NSB45676.1 triacylglycerol lipase [Clostridium saccharoperbutylacetonicum]
MIAFTIAFILSVVIVLLVCLDNVKKITLLKRSFFNVYLFFAPHIVLLEYFLINNSFLVNNYFVLSWISLTIILFILYIWLRINLSPGNKKENITQRLKVMLSGRGLILYGLYTLMIQVPIYTIGINIVKNVNIPKHIFILDIIVLIVSISILLFNGTIRILFVSNKLSIARKYFIGIISLVPGINIFIMLYLIHVAGSEYDHESYKVNNNEIKIESDVCKTKYPLMLVHGVGFRDYKYINYWGRIPKELIKNGAEIYYGNQEAWGTIEYNAYEIKERIIRVLKETNAEKVNIIAHSKGGLDARYVISKLKMGNYVASLTTISTPHRGCKFVDKACKLPNWLYKGVAWLFDKYYAHQGDKKPDFYTASRQFSTFNSKRFNEEVKDDKQVYYQSYVTALKCVISDYVLSIPYLMIKAIDGENDGLVSVESAKWGEFKGILRNKYRRGISHADIVDFRRADYKEFEVVKKYIEIVSELKRKGY